VPAHDAALRLVRPPHASADSARVASALAAAAQYAAAGRLADARKLYLAAIAEQRADTAYAASALWLLANTYYAEGHSVDAAATLAELALTAAEFGDPAMELRASFESAVLYSQLRTPERVAPLLARIRKLLRSPAIDDTLKSEVRRRMGAK
jgi:thioredoxin-like negative regulator of GroEL